MSRILKYLILLYIPFILVACENDEIRKPVSSICELEDSTIYRSHPKSDAYQSLIDSYVKRGLPGISLLVKDDEGFFIGAAGMADIKAGIKMQPCHVAKVASITKMMFGTAILRLQEKGLLSLDDPISMFIESSKLNKIGNGNKPVTVRNLLNHTSGFYDVIDDQGFYLQVLNDPSRRWNAGDLLEYTYGKDPMFDFNPEDTAGYSNTNYLLLSMIVEAVTGLPHTVAFHEEVIDRLALSNTYYYWHDELPETGVAQGYFDLYNNKDLVNLTHWNTGSGNGYTGIYTNVWDMYLFMDALFVQQSLLTEESLGQMLVFHPDTESRKLLGVACFKDFIDIGNPLTDYAYGHRGRDLGYSADMFYFPEHNAIMTLIVNYGTDSDSFLRPAFLEMRDNIAKLVVQ